MNDTRRQSEGACARRVRLATGLGAAALLACAAPRAASVPPVFAAHKEPELVAAAPKPVTHAVEKGQTLYRIARTYGISVEDLMAHNRITDPRTLAVGQVLLIPGAKEPRPIVPPGAQEAAPAAPGKPARSERREALTLPRGDGELDWPLRGVLYARYGKKGRERHDGIDLAAPLGTPVRTAKAGRVLYAGEQQGYGLIAIVDHGEALITLYAHNRDLRVRTGQRVREGQVIATVGESGRTSGPHLHFEVRKDGRPVDPLGYLGAPPVKRRAAGRRPRGEVR